MKQSASKGGASAYSKAAAARAKNNAKSKNKPGSMDDIGRGVKKVAGFIDRGVRSNPSNKGGFSNLDKILRRPVEERSIMKMPGDIAKGVDFLVRKATPLPDRKKKK